MVTNSTEERPIGGLPTLLADERDVDVTLHVEFDRRGCRVDLATEVLYGVGVDEPAHQIDATRTSSTGSGVANGPRREGRHRAGS